MSKFNKVIAALALVAGTSAFAGVAATVSVQPGLTYGNGAQADVGSVVLAVDKGPFTVDGKLQVGKARSGGAVATDVQGRITYTLGGLYGRAGVGTTAVSNKPNEDYWVFGGDVNVPVVWGLVGNAECERTKAMSGANPTFDTYKVGASYALTVKDTVGTHWVVQDGDIESHSIQASYTRKF
jgi:hypothetical protein